MQGNIGQLGKISIHAPRKGERHAGDRVRILEDNDFNPRSPQGGATWCSRPVLTSTSPFQSTLPARGSDTIRFVSFVFPPYFNPRSPQGGATSSFFFSHRQLPYFNPRSPQGGATASNRSTGHNVRISIHAPRKGERPSPEVAPIRAVYISIHAPRKGERRCAQRLSCPIGAISIHAPRKGERRYATPTATLTTPDFNPRSPQGGATIAVSLRPANAGFQSTLPARGSDWTQAKSVW